MSEEWTFASPLTLLGEWQARADEAELHELLLLGFTVDLPFLEKVAIPAARAMGARITVVGDVAMGRYDPIDVRMAGRAYFHGHAMCRGAFHPKLAVLIGEHDVIAAVGSGNPTMAGWGYNDELWTVLRGQDTGAPAALPEIGAWLEDLAGQVSVPEYVAGLLDEIAGCLTGLPVDTSRRDGIRVLHNLESPLLEQLPHGPVDELYLYAPFIDGSGEGLRRIVDRFDPGRVVIGVQERWTSYDGNAIVRALGGRDSELRRLPEQVPRHGKLLEWRIGGSRHALTGSANLTRSAMLTATAAGGNCELAVLAPTTPSLMPEAATVCSVDWLRDRRTVRPMESRPTLFLLGALLTSKGLQVTLARPYEMDVVIETSPDGSPGSWEPIGTVPAGETVRVFAVPQTAGAAVRARSADEQHAPTTSPVVFAAQPSRCGHRQASENRPRLRRAYTEEEIFTDEEMARRFRLDLIRLADQLTRHRTEQSATSRPRPATSSATPDRWEAYLDECERTIGQPLTSKVFGRLVVDIPGSSTRLTWGVDVTTTAESDADEPEPAEETEETATMPVHASERAGWRRWISRAVEKAAPYAEEKAPALIVKILIARLFVRLLGHGVWDLDDESWRRDLARLTQRLTPTDADDAPEESLQHVAVLTAVCMGLLRSGASLTGGAPEDIPAAQTWPKVRDIVARADAGLVDDLLIPPVLPHAHVLSRPELESLVDLANDDPIAHIEEELFAAGWDLEYEDGLYRVTGSFSNPIPVAARVATLLADHIKTAVVHASANGRRALIAWRRPDLVLASAPAGNTWRVYRITEPATPESRLSGSDGITSVGLIGKPVSLRLPPPETAGRLLTEAGLDPSAVARILIKVDSER
jgi:hypothetical protein